MTSTTKTDVIAPATQIAREAGALLMEYFHRHVAIEYKGEADLVTIADRKSEALIRERLREHWPSHDILGEEGGLLDTGSDSLVRRPARRHHQLCPRLSRLLRFHGTRAQGPARRRRHLRSHSRRTFCRRAGKWRLLEPAAYPCFKNRQPGRKPGRYRLPQPQAAQESQHLFLSSDYFAYARCTPGRFRRS